MHDAEGLRRRTVLCLESNGESGRARKARKPGHGCLPLRVGGWSPRQRHLRKAGGGKGYQQPTLAQPAHTSQESRRVLRASFSGAKRVDVNAMLLQPFDIPKDVVG